MFKNMKLKNKLGFSLVELLVVIAILAVLAAILVPSLVTYVEHSRAQKDLSTMDEVVNAVQVAMADQDCYDEMLRYSCTNNYLTYSDSSGQYGKQIVDAEFWAPSGSGVVTTITFNPQTNQSGDRCYTMDTAILNNMSKNNGSIDSGRELVGSVVDPSSETIYLKDATIVDGTTTACMYNRILQTVSNEIEITSQTYKNSSFTIFIVFSEIDGSTLSDIHGAFNGTNLYDGAPSVLPSDPEPNPDDPTQQKPGTVVPIMLAPNSSWYLGVTKRASITEIELVRQYKPTGEEVESWPAAADRDGDGNLENDIMCYVIGTKLIIAGNGTAYIVANPDSSYAFSDSKRSDMFKGVVAINGLELLNTSNVTSMSGMFYNCTSVQSLNIANWKTGNVTDFSGMFTCVPGSYMKFEELNVSNWDTSSAITMKFIFHRCSNLKEMDLSKWDVSNVKNLSYLFADCDDLEKINLKNWDTSSATNMDSMFNECRSLVTIDVSDFDTENVVIFDQMFELCDNLTTIIGLENWDTSKGQTFVQTFANSPKLKELDLSSWNMSKAKIITDMFRGCSSLKTIYVSDLWKFENLQKGTYTLDNVTRHSLEHVFYGCISLVGGDGTAYADNHLDYATNTKDYTYAYIGIENNPCYLTYKERPQ